MNEQQAAVWSNACIPPAHWSDRSDWRVLETRFGAGTGFLSTWRSWRLNPQRPARLHFVAITHAPPSIHDILANLPHSDDKLAALVCELSPHWFGLLPGFHRLMFDEGRVALTLCVGDLTPMLCAQQFVADTVLIDTTCSAGEEKTAWNNWAVKALARNCRRGTRLVVNGADSMLRGNLDASGFAIDAVLEGSSENDEVFRAEFNPRWVMKHTRKNKQKLAAQAGSCVVIGAGLSGASVAAALAQRGWQVTVLDQWREPAAGASGLPVGLAAPHVSADDCVLSRLSRAGLRMVLGQARRFLREGVDWQASGTLELRRGKAMDWPNHLSSAGDDWSTAAPKALLGDDSLLGEANEKNALFHRRGAWIKPAQLVRALLAQPGISFVGGARTSTIAKVGDKWELYDRRGSPLARADRVVFANAVDATELIRTTQHDLPYLGVVTEKLPQLSAVHGQLSWAMHKGTTNDDFPTLPCHGSGSLVPNIPIDNGLAWFCGASYQAAGSQNQTDEAHHLDNLARLKKLTPALAEKLEADFKKGHLNAWRSVRCVTTDRLPLVGPLYAADHPGLWICAGMGSRGLTLAALCAELLACQWAEEPFPIDSALAMSLQAMRRSN